MLKCIFTNLLDHKSSRSQIFSIGGVLLRTFRRVSIIAVVALLVTMLGNFLLVYANPDLAKIDDIKCTPYPHYKPGNTEEYDDNDADAAAAAALELNGYTCAALVNKGTLPGTFMHVGQLWQKNDGTINRIRIIIFGDSNTGFVDAKICLDDDDDPINNIAPGDPPPCYCLGADAPTYYQGADEGPSYPGDAPSANASEETSGKMEISIENLIEVVETWGGTQVGGWNINVDDYTEAILHFNKGDWSILSYYQPFTEPSCTKIYGYKWHDLDQDGVWGRGEEPPLDGWTITLTLPDTSTIDAVTGAGAWEAGYYEFEVCDLGTYRLSEELLTGDWNQTFPPSPGTHQVVVTDLGQEWGPYNFGNFAVSCTKIYGYKWHDLDQDCVWDAGEPPLDGWVITLTLPNTNTVDAITGAGDWEAGYYEFEVCDLGTYKLSEELLTGDWNQTFPPSPGTHQVVVTDLGQEWGPYNFGNVLCTKIFGYKWHDISHDGEWDPGELPVDGWTITLSLPDGSTRDAVTGDGVWEAGYYEFVVCGLGSYELSETLLTVDWNRTFPPDPGTHPVEVTYMKQEGYGPYNFGNAQTCRMIYGYKWHDKDEDGVWDQGEEPPLNGWMISLVGAQSPINETAITGDGAWDAGYYEFIVCDVDDIFTLSEVSQQTWYQTYPPGPGTHEVEVDTFHDGAGVDGPFNFGNNQYLKVGFEVYTVNKLAMMAPWVGLALAALIGGMILIMKRRETR